MALEDPIVARRRLWLNANSPAKVSLSIDPNEVLEVSEVVAAQLIAGDPHFKDVVASEPKAKFKRG